MTTDELPEPKPALPGAPAAPGSHPSIPGAPPERAPPSRPAATAPSVSHYGAERPLPAYGSFPAPPYPAGAVASLEETPVRAPPSVARPARPLRRVERVAHKVEDGLERTQAAIQRAAERTAEGAVAVAETTRRATRAPARISRDLRKAAGAWAGGLAAGIGLYAAGGVLAVAGLIVFTVALAAALNLAFGYPVGTFAVALLYAAAGVAMFLLARRAQERGRRQARQHVEEAREEVRYVTRPVRRAFSSHARAAPPPRDIQGERP